VSKKEKPLMTADELRQALVKDVQGHIREHGNKRWELLFAKHPDVSKRTIWRQISRVRNGEVTDPEMLAAAVKQAKRISIKANDVLPHAPPPAVIARATPRTSASIDFMGQFKELLDDISMLKDWSLMEKDGKKTIKNAMYFSQAIKLRISALDTGLRAYQEFWDLRRMEDFYNTILETIAEVDPEVRGLILERLQALNDERGMTIDASVGGR
jgi:hypothetical protein